MRRPLSGREEGRGSGRAGLWMLARDALACVLALGFGELSRRGRRGGGEEGRTLSSESLPPGRGVVLSPREVHVPPFLEPLEELEIVLHLAAHQAVDGDGLSFHQLLPILATEPRRPTLSIPCDLKTF